MEKDAKRRSMEKESSNSSTTQQRDDDLTVAISADQPLPVSTSEVHQPAASSPPVQQQSSTGTSSAEPELDQEAKRVKLAQETTPSPSSPDVIQPSSSGTRIQLSSIPPASQRPLYVYRRRSRSRTPPSPSTEQQTQLSITPRPSSDKIIPSAAQQEVSPTKAAAQALHARRNRVKKIKENRHGKLGPDIRPPPGPSPLGSDTNQAPLEKVKSAVALVKQLMNQSSSTKSTPPMQPSSSSSQSSAVVAPPPGSSSKAGRGEEPVPTLERVIEMLDVYLRYIPSRVTAQQMEVLLQRFQVRVEVDPVPSWYSLIKRSTEAFKESLLDYFYSETLECDNEDEDEDDDDDDPGEAGPDMPGSGSTSSSPSSAPQAA